MSKQGEGPFRRYIASLSHLPHAATRSTDIDVVNLSCQMTSMDIVPNSTNSLRSDRIRKRRVRFNVPDGVGERPAGKRRKSPSPEKYPRRRRKCTSILHGKRRSKMRQASKLSPSRLPVYRHQPAASPKHEQGSTGHQRPTTSIRSQEIPTHDRADEAKDIDAVSLNVNNNCGTVLYSLNEAVSKGKKMAAERSQKRKLTQSQNTQAKKVRKSKVVSKNLGLGTSDTKPKQDKGEKRKRKIGLCGDSKNSGTVAKKPRKAEVRSSTTKVKPVTLYKLCANPNTDTIVHTEKAVKSVAAKVKQPKGAARNTKPAKRDQAKSPKRTAKDDLMKKKLQLRIENAAHKKVALKQKLSKKCKAVDVMTSDVMMQLPMKPIKSVSNPIIMKRTRMVRIIPTERHSEYDVIAALRVSFLRYLTFKRARKEKMQCCMNFCWDYWRDVDIHDLYEDYF